MLKMSLKSHQLITLNKLLQTQNLNINRKLQCLCGHTYLRDSRLSLYKNVRVHSTQSDHRRQKAVIETSTPKIVLDKIRDLENELPKIKSSRTAILYNKIDPYIKLARWDKPIGVYLLYWPCSWSLALSSLTGTLPAHVPLQTAALFLVGAGLMRGAGCTINDMWDKDFDAQVHRTRSRPLASGLVSVRAASTFLIAQLGLALLVLLQLNCYSVLLGASSLALVIVYPLCKRITHYPQLVLGATFNWGALLGGAALTGGVPSACVPLYAAAVAWTVIYDTIYAHQDKNDDARIGLKSTALTFGPRTKPLLALTLALSAGGFVSAGLMSGMSAAYYVAVGAYVVHVGRQIHTLNIDSPDDCATKFKSNAWVGLVILLGILGGGYSQYMENRAKNAGKENLEVVRSCFFT